MAFLTKARPCRGCDDQVGAACKSCARMTWLNLSCSRGVCAAGQGPEMLHCACNTAKAVPDPVNCYVDP